MMYICKIIWKTVVMKKETKKWLLTFVFSFFVILFISIFFVLVHEIFIQNETMADYSILRYFKEHIIRPSLTSWMKFFTFMASGLAITWGYIVLLVFLFWKNQNDAFLKVIFTGVGSGILIFVSKLYYHRARPLEPLIHPLKTYSFPSGHSALGLVFYGMLTYMIWRSRLNKALKIIFSVLFVLLIPCIGVSRIYLRAHFPSDVLGGFCIGSAWLLFCYLVFGVNHKELYTSKYFKWMD